MTKIFEKHKKLGKIDADSDINYDPLFSKQLLNFGFSDRDDIPPETII